MPVQLFSLPEHIRNALLQKLDFHDFINFQQCSRDSFDAANTVKTRFTVENPVRVGEFGTSFIDPVHLRFNYSNQEIGVQIHKSLGTACIHYRKPFQTNICDFPVRFKDCQETFSDQFCFALTQFIQLTNSSMDFLSFFKVECSPSALKQLVETKNVKEMGFYGRLSPEYLKIEEIRNISCFVISGMDETEILAFNAIHFTICLSDLTSGGANEILRELLDGRRTVKYCSIRTTQNLKEKDVLEGIPILHKYSFGTCENIYIGSDTVYRIDIGRSNIKIIKATSAEISAVSSAVIQNSCAKRNSLRKQETAKRTKK